MVLDIAHCDVRDEPPQLNHVSRSPFHARYFHGRNPIRGQVSQGWMGQPGKSCGSSGPLIYSARGELGT
jgi:hypothetical protein